MSQGLGIASSQGEDFPEGVHIYYEMVEEFHIPIYSQIDHSFNYHIVDVGIPSQYQTVYVTEFNEYSDYHLTPLYEISIPVPQSPVVFLDPSIQLEEIDSINISGVEYQVGSIYNLMWGDTYVDCYRLWCTTAASDLLTTNHTSLYYHAQLHVLAEIRFAITRVNDSETTYEYELTTSDVIMNTPSSTTTSQTSATTTQTSSSSPTSESSGSFSDFTPMDGVLSMGIILELLIICTLFNRQTNET